MQDLVQLLQAVQKIRFSSNPSHAGTLVQLQVRRDRSLVQLEVMWDLGQVELI